MSQSTKAPCSANAAPLYAVQPQRTPARRRAGALLMGTALSAVIGLGYGRGAYAQDQGTLSGPNNQTVIRTGPGEFVTEDGFSVDTSDTAASVAIDITADGGAENTTLRDYSQSVIEGADQGLRIYKSDGTGGITVTSTGLISASEDNSRAINIRQFLDDRDNFTAAPGGAIDITVNDIQSNGRSSSGIDINNRSESDVEILIQGSVLLGQKDSQYGTGTGVEVTNSYGVGDTSIEVTGDVYAGNMGIYVNQKSSGDVHVDVDGSIQVHGGYGVVVDHAGNTGDINIEVTNVDGQMAPPESGYQVSYYGTVPHSAVGVYSKTNGRISITSTGDVGVNGYPVLGIYAYNKSSESRGITISANNVYGGRGASQYSGSIAEYADAIRAYSNGGALEIHATGNVDSEVRAGIKATADGIGAAGDTDLDGNSLEGVSLTITANTVTGGTYGIYADNEGSGALSITTTGTVMGTGDGIRAYNYGTNLTVSANAIQSTNAYGIFARNYGTGILKVETTGDVSASSDGIYAESEWSGSGPYPTDVIVSAAADVSSDYGTGIRVNNYGTGALSVTATGAVTASTGNGIYAKAYGVGAAGTTDLDSNSLEGISVAITANAVTGGTYGIYADNDGSGALSITANGAVTGVTDDGIYANNASTEDLTITIAEGGSVSTSGTDAEDWAIQATAPSGDVIVDNFGTVTGRVNLTNSNTFTNAGTWDLAGTTSDFNATGNSDVVNEGLIIAASDGAADEISAIDNLDTFRSNAGGTIRLADGGAGDVFVVNGTFDGTATAGGSGTGTTAFIANGGGIAMDVSSDGSVADRLIVAGNVTLDTSPTALAFNGVGGGAGGAQASEIEVVTVAGTSDAGAFVLAGPAEVGALSYDLSLGQCDDTANDNWYLCNNGAIGTTGAVFEAMPGVVLNSFARTETLQQRLGARVQGGTGPTLSTQGDADLPVAQSVGPWMRTWGDFADITPDNSTAGTSWEADSWGLEAGIGTILGDHAGGNLVGGVNLRYGATYADLINPVGTASLNAEGFGMAASLTWFGNDGFYVDGNAAVDFVSIDATSQGGGELLNDHDDVVYSASAEVGKRIELEGGTTLVPQAQLSWGKMRDGSLTDNLGNVVSFADRETLTSRVGLTVEQDVTGSSWGAGKVFGFGNVLHDLEGSRTATVAGTDVTQSGTGDWLELGGGFSLQPTENSNLFGQVSYREAFNGVDGDAIAVSAGWRMQW